MQCKLPFVWNSKEQFVISRFGGHVARCVSVSDSITDAKEKWEKADWEQFEGRHLRRWEVEVEKRKLDRRKVRAAKRVLQNDRRLKREDARMAAEHRKRLKHRVAELIKANKLRHATAARLFEGGEFDADMEHRPFDNDDPFYKGDEPPPVIQDEKPKPEEVIAQAKFSHNYNLLAKFAAVVPAADMKRHYAEDGSSWSHVLGYYYQSIGTRPPVMSAHVEDWLLYQQCNVALSCHHLKTGELLWEVPEYDQRCMVFWRGNIYLGNGDGTVICVDKRTGESLWTKIVHTAAVTSIGIHQRRNTIISAADDGSVVCTSIGALVHREVWAAHEHERGDITDLVVDETRDRVITSSMDGTMKALNVMSGGARWSLNCDNIYNFVLDRFRGLVFLATSSPMLTAYDSEEGTMVWKTKAVHQSGITAVTCTEYWGMVFSGDRQGMVNAWSSENGSQLWSFNSLWTPITGFVTDRRRELLMAQTMDGLFMCWDLQSGRPAWHVPPRDPSLYSLVTATHTFPLKDIVTSVIVNGSLMGRSWKTLMVTWERPGAHFDYIRCSVTVPSTGMLITGGGDGRVRAWSMKSGLSLWTAPVNHDDDITFLAIDVERNVVVSGSYDRDLRCWDLQTGALKWWIEGPSHPQDPDVLAAEEKGQLVAEVRAVPPTTIKEVLASYDPNKKLEAERRLKEELKAHAEAQHEAQMKKYSKKSTWTGTVGGSAAEPWDPMGTLQPGLSIAQQRKLKEEAEARSRRPLRAYMLSGAIRKKPPRIAVRELHNYGLAWGYDNSSAHNPEEADVETGAGADMQGNAAGLGFPSGKSAQLTLFTVDGVADKEWGADNQEMDKCLPGKQKHVPRVTKPRVPWEDPALMGSKPAPSPRVELLSDDGAGVPPVTPPPPAVSPAGATPAPKKGWSVLRALSSLLPFKVTPKATHVELLSPTSTGPRSPDRRRPRKAPRKRRKRKGGLPVPNSDSEPESASTETARVDVYEPRPGEGGHNSPITCGAMDTKRGLLVSGAKDQLLKCWDVERAVLKWTSPVHQGEVRHVVVDEAAGLVVSTAGEKMRAWNIETGELMWKVSAHMGVVGSLVVDSGIVLSVMRAEVKKWNVADGSPYEAGNMSCCWRCAVEQPSTAVHNASSIIHRIKPTGSMKRSRRILLVITGEFVDILKLKTFERLDRVRFLLGPLVDAHLTVTKLLAKPKLLYGVDEEGEMQVMLLQKRYSWHKTAINHHSLLEWGPADRRRSEVSWLPAMLVAAVLLLFEWIQMFSLAYPEQDQAGAGFNFTIPEPMDDVNDALHRLKTFDADDMDYSVALSLSLLVTGSLIVALVIQQALLDLMFRFPWMAVLKTLLDGVDFYAKVIVLFTGLPVFNVYWKAVQCNYFDDPGDRFIAIPNTDPPDVDFQPSNFTAHWLQDPDIDCFSGEHLPFILWAVIGGAVYMSLAVRFARARYKIVGLKGGLWGLLAVNCFRDAVSRPNRGVAAFERSHPLKLMDGKLGLTLVCVKLFVTFVAVIFYKFPPAIALVTGLLGLFIILMSHRWPPYYFNALNRFRLGLDYALGYMYVVGAITVLYYTDSFEWFFNTGLPVVVSAIEEDSVFTPSDAGRDTWDDWLKRAPALIVLAFVFGLFAEFVDRGLGRWCCNFCRCAASDRFWVEKDERRGCCGREEHVSDDEDDPQPAKPPEPLLDVTIPGDIEPDLTIDEGKAAAGASTAIQAADGIEELIRLQDKLHGRVEARVGQSTFMGPAKPAEPAKLGVIGRIIASFTGDRKRKKVRGATSARFVAEFRDADRARLEALPPTRQPRQRRRPRTGTPTRRLRASVPVSPAGSARTPQPSSTRSRAPRTPLSGRSRQPTPKHSPQVMSPSGVVLMGNDSDST